MSETTDSAEAIMARMYKALAFHNAIDVSRKLYMEEYRELDPQRTRMTKQIAQHLIETRGDAAYIYALEKLDSDQPKAMWRDVLSWLDDLTKEGEKK